MKRSNRLVLLVGVFLAIVAFVGILLLVRSPGGPNTPTVPTTATVVVAATDIALSTKISADQLTTKVVPLNAVSEGAFVDPSQVVGQIARETVATGAQITATTLTGGLTGQILNVETPAGQRAMSIRVDQVSGVGTIIKAGDYVDAIFALTEEQFASVKVDPTNKTEVTVTNPGPKGTTVKLVLQGIQVLGALLPPVSTNPVAAPAASGAPASSAEPGTVLNDQQEIVILSVTAQQAEVIRFAQVQANPLATASLVLRSAKDFVDPKTGQPVVPPPDKTTGITLRSLLDQYGVLPPVVETPVLGSSHP